MVESKSRAKFVELAEKRVVRTIRDMRLIGNLSNRSNYSYTDDDVRKIMKALRTEPLAFCGGADTYPLA